MHLLPFRCTCGAAHELLSLISCYILAVAHWVAVPQLRRPGRHQHKIDRQLCSAQVIREMESMRKQWVAMALGFLVVLALAAEEVNAQCSLSAMAPCYSAVTGAYPPQPAGGPSGSCCAAVRTANPACMCSQFQQGSYPPNMIRNAFAMPRVCQRYDIRGYRCGGYTIE